MSKILITLSFPHDRPQKPQLIVSVNNVSTIHVAGKDFVHCHLQNSNPNRGFKNRFEYAVTGGKGTTRLSIIINTTVTLPHFTWSIGTLGSSKKVVATAATSKVAEEGKRKGQPHRRQHQNPHSSKYPANLRFRRPDDAYTAHSYHDHGAGIDKARHHKQHSRHNDEVDEKVAQRQYRRHHSGTSKLHDDNGLFYSDLYKERSGYQRRPRRQHGDHMPLRGWERSRSRDYRDRARRRVARRSGGERTPERGQAVVDDGGGGYEFDGDVYNGDAGGDWE